MTLALSIYTECLCEYNLPSIIVLPLSNRWSETALSLMTDPETGYNRRNAYIRTCRCYASLYTGVCLYKCVSLLRRWRRNTHRLGHSSARAVGSGWSSPGEARRILRGDRPHFHSTLGRGTRMQGGYISISLSISLPSP